MQRKADLLLLSFGILCGSDFPVFFPAENHQDLGNKDVGCQSLPCTQRTATPGSSRWIPPCSSSSFLVTTHLCLPPRTVTWIHLHVPVKICDDAEDTVLALVVQEDCHQDATKFPVTYHQVPSCFVILYVNDGATALS